MTFDRIATHGDTEDQVRQAMLDYAGPLLSEFRLELRAEGLPLEAIEKIMALVEKTQHERIEADLPQIMKNMAIGAGAAQSH